MEAFVAVAAVELAEVVALAVGMLTFIDTLTEILNEPACEVLETPLMLVLSLAIALVKLGIVETWFDAALSRLLISLAAVLISVAAVLISVAAVLISLTAFVGMSWVLILDGRLMPLFLAQVSGRMFCGEWLVTCCETISGGWERYIFTAVFIDKAVISVVAVCCRGVRSLGK